jgi:formylmethanofuran dehydrogenase subunit E
MMLQNNDFYQTEIERAIEASTTHHQHLCPRQVLGVRIGLAGAAALGLETHRKDKRLLVIVESDGCFTDGISSASGCTVGHRTLRVEDYGKVAATFVDVINEQAYRVAPRLDVRERAWDYAHGETRRYFAQLRAYQIMPADELLSIQEVQLTIPVKTLISRPGLRVNCVACGEEIINEREVYLDNDAFCRTCAGQTYYVHEYPRLPIYQTSLAQVNQDS